MSETRLRQQDGDAGGHLRRAMEQFPVPGVSAEVMRRYFLPEGRPPGAPYKPVPMYKQVVSRVRHQLTMLANFCEVWLAKEGHDGKVGINLLTKVQMPNLGSLYGAMLGGVDYVLMGAGIPREIPGVLDRFARPCLAHEVHSADGAVPGPDLPDLRMHRAGELRAGQIVLRVGQTVGQRSMSRLAGGSDAGKVSSTCSSLIAATAAVPSTAASTRPASAASAP